MNDWIWNYAFGLYLREQPPPDLPLYRTPRRTPNHEVPASLLAS